MKTILVDAIDAFIIEVDDGSFKIFDKMYKMLEKFPNRKIILTGAKDEDFKKYGLDKIPYEVFTLRHNPEKTDPEYYKRMLNHFNLEVEDVVYFEHNPAAIASAQSVGINTYYWDDQKQSLRELDIFLKDNA